MATANLFKRGDTYWWREMIDGVQHRRSTGHKDFDLAKTAARELARAVRAGEHKVVVPTYDAWVLKYLGGAAHNRKGAAERDPYLLRTSTKEWKGRSLDAIRRSDCETLLATLRGEGCTPGTVWLKCIRVKFMFRLAMDEKLLSANPWKGIKLPRPTKRKRVLTREEQGVLVPSLAPHWARLVEVALGTGLRRGELFSIGQKHYRGAALNLTADITKGGKERSIPVRPEVAEALNTQATLLPTSSAKFWDYHHATATMAIRRAAKTLGLPGITLHDMRRTFGTRCAEAGMPLAHLQKLMGHSSPTITSQFYVFVGEKTVKDSLLGLDL